MRIWPMRPARMALLKNHPTDDRKKTNETKTKILIVSGSWYWRKPSPLPAMLTEPEPEIPPLKLLQVWEAQVSQESWRWKSP